jgi:sulfite reductase beta subunit-like hemoprotein
MPLTLTREEFELQHDRTVRQEIEAFRERANEYLSGSITEDEFRGFRLRHGTYGQRQPGVQMIRTKFPGGTVTAAQMDQLALVADEFAGGKGHITTRQNIQYHFVPLKDVADMFHRLADVGLTTREACFNTVRNVTACPKAGLSRHEIFDVRPYAQKIAYAFLRKGLTDSMPRKFKIAFDGCQHDDMLTAIHDIGLRAVIRDGKRGFRMVVGGGLGPMPVEAQVLDEFVPEELLIHHCEAVVRVFNNYGNRKNRNKARLKFVMKERGFEWLREAIDKEYQDIVTNGGIPMPEFVPEGFGGYLSNPQPLGAGSLLPIVNTSSSGDAVFDRWLETNVEEQAQTGYAMVTVTVDQGNLTSAQMRTLAKVAADAGDGLVRVTIDQNLILGFVQLANLKRVHAALAAVDLGAAGAHEIDDVVTCPGAYSCNLALTKSMNLGAALQTVVRGYDHPEIRKLAIKVSGCPNACGQHWTADFGFYGNARKIDGKEIPYYLMLLGGGSEADGKLQYGLAVQSIPARLAPTAVQRVIEHYLANREADESFRSYVMRQKIAFFKQMTADLVKPPELFPEIYQDWGDTEAYSLQLGRGECAA